jgi:hypothetical protein
VASRPRPIPCRSLLLAVEVGVVEAVVAVVVLVPAPVLAVPAPALAAVGDESSKYPR